MQRKKRKLPGINGSALSDITFLFLTFFMLVSNMDSDTGLARRLPPPPQDDQNLQSIDVQRRNLLVVLVNKDNETFVSNMHGNETYASVDELMGRGSSKVSLKEKVKEFVLNTNNSIDLPEVSEKDFGAPIGMVPVTESHVISLQNDATTSYWAYIAVQNELVRAYNELRQDASLKYFGIAYDQLTEDQKQQINDIYPQRISEAEPKNYGGATQ